MARNSERSIAFGALALLLALALAGAAGILYLRSAEGGAAPTGNDPALAALSQAIPLHAASALRGDLGAFASLEDDLSRLARLGGSGAGFDDLQRHAADIFDKRAAVSAISNAAEHVDRELPALLDTTDLLLDETTASGTIREFQDRAVEMRNALTGLAADVALGDAETAASGIAADIAFLRTVVDALSGSETSLDVAALDATTSRDLLTPVAGILLGMETEVASAIAGSAELAGVGASLAGANQAAANLLNSRYSGTARPAAATDDILNHPLLPIGLIGLALLLLIVLAVIHSKTAVFKVASREQSEQNDKNQQAILRLLDELGSLADGDLTVEATVTEDITGAIADSINYAIEKLRELVATIDETALMVDSAAKQTKNTAVNMARAADTQTREISAASESIVSMASSIEEVSGNAERSSDVARHSVDIAHKGGDAVRRTIDGMNTIRETIQETSKRIKRLGESSQEIGNIIELINDIAEQTNILALNASIQASMAGEAGRGFAVVADEVQRLAERSTNATKQIEVLVRTIQSDTNEAVISMERSTTDVVGGALLAENAGAALDEIEQVSNQIANLVQNISESARKQAGSAADVTRRTTKLKEISDQTGKATTATAASISKLSELASQLRSTIAGFTLPAAVQKGGALSASLVMDKPATDEVLREIAAGEKAAG